MLIGVISDTHGLMRPEALRALGGSELIIHAGDVGDPKILDELRAIAPLIAVRGNIDQGEWASSLPENEVVERQGASLYVLHDLNQLDLDPAAAGFQAVISGHSHKPAIRRQNGVLYLNPGSAGPRRFKLPITVARLHLGEKGLEAEHVHLDLTPSSGKTHE
jgi:putative phosphoesterase